MEVIKWLRSSGWEWGEREDGACSAAVDGGHLLLGCGGCGPMAARRWLKGSCLNLVQRKQRDRPQEEAHLWTAAMGWIGALPDGPADGEPH
jgi:hypothetical protein